MPRISIQVDDALDDRLNQFLPWGIKQKVMETLCVMLCDAVEKHGKQIVGLLVNREYNLVTGEVLKKEDD